MSGRAPKESRYHILDSLAAGSARDVDERGVYLCSSIVRYQAAMITHRFDLRT